MEQAVRGLVASPAQPVAVAEHAATGTTPIDGAGLTPATQLRPPGLLELEELLADRLDTRVAVTMGAKRGRVTIDFADLEDLERIYRLMSG
jgi:ParB family chromosome partitioning protein